MESPGVVMTFALGAFLRRTCRFLVFLLPVLSLVPPSTRAQSTAAAKDAEILRQMRGSFEGLVTRVSPAVVEVLVIGYGAHEEDDDRGSSSFGRERSVGSGVIVELQPGEPAAMQVERNGKLTYFTFETE